MNMRKTTAWCKDHKKVKFLKTPPRPHPFKKKKKKKKKKTVFKHRVKG